MALWTPALIDPALWLDAADASTLTLDAGAVSEWMDKSGNLRHLAQATAGSRPTLSTDKIEMNGSQSMAFTPAASAEAFASYFLIASVFDVSTVTAFTRPPIGTDNNVDLGRPLDRWHSSTTNAFIIDGSNGVDTTTVGLRTATSPRLHLMIGKKDAVSAGTHTVWERMNGSASFTGSRVRTWSVSGQRIRLGRRGDGTATLNGWVGEVVALDVEPASGEIEKIEGYLAHKWGLTANLPAEHPYKNAAPQALTFTGTTRDKTGALAARTVTALREYDQTVVGTTTSDPITGAYEIATTHDEAHTLIFSGEADRNAIVYSGVMPS